MSLRFAFCSLFALFGSGLALHCGGPRRLEGPAARTPVLRACAPAAPAPGEWPAVGGSAGQRNHGACQRAVPGGRAPPKSLVRTLLGWYSFTADQLESVYAFSRPHTVRGTLLACATGVGRALWETPSALYLPLLPALVPRALVGVTTLVLGNLFIVGINQIFDVDVDVVNKPLLPIAAGVMTPAFAWGVVLSSLTAGLALVRTIFSPLIYKLYAFGLLIGGPAYSVPPVQLKRFPLAAGLTIACCRGFLLNFGV